MEDRIVRAMAQNDSVRIISAVTTNLVNDAVKIHGCSATAAAALGRMLTAGSIMGTMLKSEDDSLTIKINGGGEAKGVIVVAYSDGSVKGYIGNPNVELPPNSKGKLDVGGSIGKNGNLIVIKDMGLKEPYVGQVPIMTGEIGDDLAYYFAVSEQVPSAVAVGVLVNKDFTIKASGGFIIQLMPDCDEDTINFVNDRVKGISSVTSMIINDMDAKDIIEHIFSGSDLKILDQIRPSYKCNCSRSRVERALISIGREELQKIYDDGKTEELKCNFCNKSYKFTHEQIGKILELV